MPWTHDATNPAPWTAATKTAALTAPIIDISYQLGLGIGVNPAAWDIDADIDIARSPTAIAHAKVPYGTTVALGDDFRLTAGIGTDLQPVCLGIVTGIERRVIGPDRWIELTAASREQLLDLPSDIAYTPPSWATQLTDIMSTALGATPFQPWGGYLFIDNQTTIAPTSAQYTALRATDIGLGDNIDTWLHTLADTLGQRLTGNYLNYTGHYLLRDRNPATAPPLTIDPIVTDLRRRTSIDDLCNVVDLTATWHESNQEKSSRRIYATSGTPAIRAARNYTIVYRPPLSGGVRQLTATNPTAQAYLTRSTTTEVATITTRALWWLQPLHRITADGATWTIQQIRHQLTTGTMTITATR